MIPLDLKVKDSNTARLLDAHSVYQHRQLAVGPEKDITNTQVLRFDPKAVQAWFDVFMIKNNAVFVNNFSCDSFKIRLIGHNPEGERVRRFDDLLVAVFTFMP